jgi:hypothetical protein
MYDFYDSEIDEYFTLMMGISERSDFLEDNPQVKQVHLTAPMIVSSVGTMEGKIQNTGWEENLQRIAAAHPRSALSEKYHRRDSKEVSTDRVLNKAKKRAKERFNIIKE